MGTTRVLERMRYHLRAANNDGTSEAERQDHLEDVAVLVESLDDEMSMHEDATPDQWRH